NSAGRRSSQPVDDSCGSRSSIATRWRLPASQPATLVASVVLPLPPFGFAIRIVCTIGPSQGPAARTTKGGGSMVAGIARNRIPKGGTWLAGSSRLPSSTAMPLDPSTLIARTAAGDAELAAPRHGLVIAQRRLLTILDHPVPLDELVARPGVHPDRLERDLARLAEHGLVEIHRPVGASGPMFPAARRPAAT